MEKTNPVIEMCQKGMVMEKKGNTVEARDLYMSAWDKSSNDYERCIAAHFVARQQNNKEDTLQWNIEALKYADNVPKEEVVTFYPSLYLCIGLSYENLGNIFETKKYFDLAFEKVSILDNDSYGKGIRKNILKARNRNTNLI